MDLSTPRSSKPTVWGSNPHRRADYTDPSWITRFLAKVDRSGGPDACWPWTAYRQKHGYGTLLMGNRPHRWPGLAHRLSWWLANGAPPADGVVIRHRCDNPPCVNPDHLEAGTQSQNCRDMVERGRSLFGQRNHKAKLTDEQALEVIARRRDGETMASIAADLGVDTSLVGHIQHGRAWKHLTRTTAVQP